MIWLPAGQRAKALALQGAAPFEPMGNGVVSKDKIMLPVSVMRDPAPLKHWIGVAFEATAALPAKSARARKPAKSSKAAKQKPPSNTR